MGQEALPDRGIIQARSRAATSCHYSLTDFSRNLVTLHPNFSPSSAKCPNQKCRRSCRCRHSSAFGREKVGVAEGCPIQSHDVCDARSLLGIRKRPGNEGRGGWAAGLPEELHGDQGVGTLWGSGRIFPEGRPELERHGHLDGIVGVDIRHHEFGNHLAVDHDALVAPNWMCFPVEEQPGLQLAHGVDPAHLGGGPPLLGRGDDGLPQGWGATLDITQAKGSWNPPRQPKNSLRFLGAPRLCAIPRVPLRRVVMLHAPGIVRGIQLE
eukprot:s6406_g4.t1